jgi:hypothetical protein
LQCQIHKRRDERVQVQPQFMQVAKDKIIGATRWIAGDGRHAERFQVITFRDGKITDMQGCTSLHAAERFARRH